MNLDYKLEYIGDGQAEESVFVHLRENPPIYMPRTAKEDYDTLAAGEKHDFLTAIYDIAGVVEVSSKAFRLWLMKARTYNWEDVMLPLLDYLKTYYNKDELNQLAGSANPDGTGARLESVRNRRYL